jgi:hypothetical protein
MNRKWPIEGLLHRMCLSYNTAIDKIHTMKKSKGDFRVENQVLCPNCKLPMKKIAVSETKQNGKKIVSYACPNHSGCGTVIRREE